MENELQRKLCLIVVLHHFCLVVFCRRPSRFDELDKTRRERDRYKKELEEIKQKKKKSSAPTKCRVSYNIFRFREKLFKVLRVSWSKP